MNEQLTSVSVADQDTEKEYPDLDSVQTLDNFQVYKKSFLPELTSEQLTEHAKRIEAGKFAEYMRDHPEEQGPNKIEQDELDWLIEDGEQALNNLVSAHAGYVVSIARGYRGSEVELLDKTQDGNIALLQAIWRFDYTRGVKLTTFADQAIHRDIWRGIVKNSRNISLPREKYEAVIALNRARNRFFQEHERQATVGELAEIIEVAPAVIRDLQLIAQDIVSLDEPESQHGELTLGDRVADGRDDELERAVQYSQDIQRLNELMNMVLIGREQEILKRTYGLGGKAVEAASVMAGRFGISTVQVHKIRRDALYQLSHFGESTLGDAA